MKRPIEIWTRYDDGSMDYVKVSIPAICGICRVVRGLISPFMIKNRQTFKEELLCFSERFYGLKSTKKPARN